MSDLINVNEELKLATISTYGEISVEEIAQSIEMVNQLYLDGIIDKVMVFADMQEKLPTFDELYKVSKIFSSELKIALMMSKNKQPLQELKFLEITSQNKGKPVKIFNSMHEANSWLSE